MNEVSKELTVAGDEVAVDSIVRQLSIEAEAGKRRALNDVEHHKKGLDEAASRVVYWQGRADTLSLLLDRAAQPKPGTPDVAAPESSAPTPAAKSDFAQPISSAIEGFDRGERDSI